MADPKWRQRGGKGYLRPSTGELLPGVTTLCRALDAAEGPGALIGWATKLTAAEAVRTLDDWRHLKTAEEAERLIKASSRRQQNVKRDTGTAVHELLEAVVGYQLKGEPLPDCFEPLPQLKPYLDAFTSFQEETGWAPLLTEVTLVNTEWHYAGTCDAIGQVGADIVLLDYKTGRLRAPQMAAQLALLSAADLILDDDGTEHTSYGVDKLWVVQISPGDYTIHEVDPPPSNVLEDLLMALPAVQRLTHELGSLVHKLPEPLRVVEA